MLISTSGGAVSRELTSAGSRFGSVKAEPLSGRPPFQACFKNMFEPRSIKYKIPWKNQADGSDADGTRSHPPTNRPDEAHLA